MKRLEKLDKRFASLKDNRIYSGQVEQQSSGRYPLETFGTFDL